MHTQVFTSNTVGVDVADRHEVVLGVEMTPVGYRKRLVSNGVTDGPPDVDDAYASLEETVSIRTKMAMHTGNTSFESLVDVDALLIERSRPEYIGNHSDIPQAHAAAVQEEI